MVLVAEEATVVVMAAVVVVIVRHVITVSHVYEVVCMAQKWRTNMIRF